MPSDIKHDDRKGHRETPSSVVHGKAERNPAISKLKHAISGNFHSKSNASMHRGKRGN
jgi:hypothetical protein